MIKNISFLLIILMLTACGGGGGGSDNTNSNTSPVTPPPPEAPTILTGAFYDSLVSGLNYQTETQSGTTNQVGEFDYVANEQITFSIGDIQFPIVMASEVLTPLEIFATDDIDNTAVINTIRLLQTLDFDGIAGNGIEILENIHMLAAGMTVDFSSPEFDSQVQTLVANSGGTYTQLIDAYTAKMHFQQTLNELNGTNTSGCTSNHSKVGYTGTFQTHFHNVAGQAHIVDDCTIEITNFDYDGEGPDVFFYGALNGEYGGESGFAIGDQINGRVYEGETLTLRLTNGKKLDDLDGISVWCVDFKANFGDLTFTQP